MNINFIKWVHDELVALRAALNKLEGHSGIAASAAVPKPDEVLQSIAPATVVAPIAPVAVAPAPAAATAAPSNPILDSYLHSGGNANTPAGQASIAAAQAVAAAQPDGYAKGYLKGIGDAIRCTGSGSFEVREDGPCAVEALSEAAQSGTTAPSSITFTVAGVPTTFPLGLVQAAKSFPVTGPCVVGFSSDTGGTFNVVLRQL